MERMKLKRTRPRTPLVAAAVRPSTQNWLNKVLPRTDYLVKSLDTSADLVQQVSESAPDVIIIDLKMPSMDGLKALRELRRRGAEIPAIFVTAKITPNEARKVFTLGPADYVVTNATDKAALIPRLERLLAASHVELDADEVVEPLDRSRSIKVTLSELHDSRSGRIDAELVAHYMNIPLIKLSEAIGVKYTTVQKTPDAPALQEVLTPIKRSLEILIEVFRNKSDVLTWLNNPHPDLGLRSPIQVISEGQADAVRTMLENAIAGIPT